MTDINAVRCGSCTRLVPVWYGQHGPKYVDHPDSQDRGDCVNSHHELGPVKAAQVRKVDVTEVEA